MMSTKKYLCWVIVALMFLAVLSGGCGGGGSGPISSNSNEQNTESENDNATQEGETTPTTGSPTDEKGAATGLDGTWKTTSGTYLMDDSPLLSTSNVVTISVEKNSADSYYSINFTGDSVVKLPEANNLTTGTDTYINCVFDGTSSYGEETYSYLPVPVGGSLYEYSEENKTYRLYYTVLNDAGDEINASRTFELIDNSTVKFNYTSGATDDEGNTFSWPMYELTFTRVE